MGKIFTVPIKARSRESGGTGVGLSIVKATAELLGGRCGAKNVPGGMEFWFLRPIPKPSPRLCKEIVVAFF